MSNTTLVSLDELKAYISINENNSTYDAPLQQLARVATKALEAYCRRSFLYQAYTEHFDTRDTARAEYDVGGDWSNDTGIIESAAAQRFPLKGLNVDFEEDITVHYSAARVYDASTLVDNDLYYFNDAGNTLYLLKATAKARRSVRIAYSAGYAANAKGVLTEAPDDLKLAAITQVMFLFNKMNEANIGVKGSKKHSPEYIQNANMLCPEAQALVLPYRRNLMGRY